VNVLTSTIGALSTPQGLGAIAIVRLSGPEVKEFTLKICKKADLVLSSPRLQVYTPIYGPSGVLDYSLVTYFKGPDSYTGEDSLEVSLHASPYIVKEFLRFIYSLGVVPASPGEFTRRAYENGKLDLLQAEAVADLIHSESEAQARVARSQLEGKLSGVIDELGEPLRNTLAEIEAYIDFPDEDINPDTSEAWKRSLSSSLLTLNKYIDSYSSGKLFREGISVTLCGVPNAGKSSLMNQLLKEDRAIVSATPGTTRDYIEEKIIIDGILVKLIDTAGLGDTTRQLDEPEQIGMRKSRERIFNSDLVLFLVDPVSNLEPQKDLFKDLNLDIKKTLVLVNKLDLGKPSVDLGFISNFKKLEISASTGLGVDELKEEILKLIDFKDTSQTLITTERQRDAFLRGREALDKAIKAIDANTPSEYVAFEVRDCLNAMTEIIGVSSTEDILGRIFSKFCIGK
jgi:tRNA modification GTPase